MGRRGVTLVELLIAMVLASIVGASLIRIGVEQARFNERQESGRSARAVSRAAINYITTELRMADAHNAVTQATATRVRLRVPFAVGLVCQATTSSVTGAFMPVDSTLLLMGQTGFAVRDPLTGQLQYYMNDTPAVTVSGSACTGSPANMTLMPGALVRRLDGALVGVPAVGTPVYMIRNLEYEFAPSVDVPGRVALWRRRLNQSNGVLAQEELAAPFDSTSRFRFYINNNRVASDTLPTDLEDLRGLEIRLSGESERTSRSRQGPEQANLTTSIFFLNRLD
jgi:prepilin-type N-terminal cleavage/methylation domain-containing protein